MTFQVNKKQPTSEYEGNEVTHKKSKQLLSACGESVFFCCEIIPLALKKFCNLLFTEVADNNSKMLILVIGAFNMFLSMLFCVSDAQNLNARPIARQTLRDFCNLPPEVGPCKGSFTRSYFDASTGTCKTFEYGGCGGNKNK